MKKVWAVGTIIAAVLGGVMVVGLNSGDVTASPVDTAKKQIKDVGGEDSNLSAGQVNSTVQNVINFLIGLVGIIAVVMIIIGGIGFATSQGDPGKVKKGKDTILFGIIGLVVAILAFAIVNFVLNNVFKNPSDYTTEATCEAENFKWVPEKTVGGKKVAAHCEAK